MQCENWEEGSFLIEGPDGMQRRLRSLLWYDGPRIFLFPHDGADRLFTCTDETEDGMVYHGASPSPDLMETICRNGAPLIHGYETGPFFQMTWPHGSAWPTEIVEIDAFPEEMLPDPNVLLVYEPKSASEDREPSP
jgi:hypothetical protein